MRRLALAIALCGAGCLDFSSLGDRFQGDAATQDGSDDGSADLGGDDLPSGACPAAAGPITFVDQASVEQGQPLIKTLVLPRPPSIQACDVMVLMFFVDLGSTITDPPGWNKFVDLPSAKNFETRYYWRTATATEPTSYDLHMDPEQFAAASIVAYRGVDTTSPLEGSLMSVCHGPPTTIPGFTPAHLDDQVVMMCLCDTGFGINPMFTDPAAMQLRALSIATGVWDAPQASGAVPQRSVNCNTSSELCCLELALHSTP